MLGLRRGGNDGFEVEPSFGSGLDHCEGSLSFPQQGKLHLHWSVFHKNGTARITLDTRSYRGGAGTIGLPNNLAAISVKTGQNSTSNYIWLNGHLQTKQWSVEKRREKLWFTISKRQLFSWTVIF